MKKIISQKWFKSFALILPILFLCLIEIIELFMDYIFGDGDGKIINSSNSKLILSLQIIAIILFVLMILYNNKNIFHFIVRYILYIFFLFLCLDMIVLDKIIFRQKENDFKDHRYPTPYVGFVGKPFWEDHNKNGFRGKMLSDAKPDEFLIAFFGGSTGYLGDPPIPNIVEENLKKKKFNNGKIFVSNYSVVSSNHNQHLHILVEYLINERPDLIIFYGGYNETIQSAHYDPRPGFPFNFFYIYDVPHYIKFIFENSAFLKIIDKKYGLIFHNLQLKKHRLNENVYSNEWNNKIINNYFGVLKSGKKIISSFESQYFNRSEFLAFYQPYQVPSQFLQAHEKIRSNIKSIEYLIDLSTELKDLDQPFYDVVHLNQNANELMAKAISDVLIDRYHPVER